jgi:DNA-directed RNA polymerase specialized sigma24 family protein
MRTETTTMKHREHPAEAPLSLQGAASQRLLESARNVLSRLPAEQREVVVLLGYYHLTRDEIGALLGQPVARVDALFRSAVRSLRGILGSDQRPSFAA